MIPIIEALSIDLAGEGSDGLHHILELTGDEFDTLYQDVVLSDDPTEKIIFRSPGREITVIGVRLQGIDRRFEDRREFVKVFITGRIQLPMDLKVWNESV